MRSTGLDKTNRTPGPSYRSIAEQAYRDIDRLTAQRDALREALADVEKRCWQADAASRIGHNAAGKTVRFLQGELGEIESAARAALALSDGAK